MVITRPAGLLAYLEKFNKLLRVLGVHPCDELHSQVPRIPPLEEVNNLFLQCKRDES